MHHIFPKKYLTANGITNKSEYNQIANYTYLDTQVNKDISDDAPCDYFSKAIAASQAFCIACVLPNPLVRNPRTVPQKNRPKYNTTYSRTGQTPYPFNK